jgi:hypothetical protein
MVNKSGQKVSLTLDDKADFLAHLRKQLSIGDLLSLEVEGEDVEEQEPEALEAEAPPGNGSREAWVDYALSQGKTEEDITGLTRDEIRALFTD